jgi:uncharacterized FAD-dependent dehydrogenase
VLRLTEIKLDLDHPEAALKTAILRALGISEPELLGYHVRRRGYDARKSGQVVFVYTLDAEVKDEPALLARFKHSLHIRKAPDETYHYPVQAPANFGKRPVVIGTGPCGLFAGLSLARMGFRPLILERGKDVRERSQDVWGFWRQGRLNPESNVQFGEGGAGTFSDGKLHTGIKDRGHHIKRILQDFVDADAPGEILYISKPHIGTLRLVKVVENLRHKIVELGGEIRFESHVTDIVIENGSVRGVILAEETPKKQLGENVPSPFTGGEAETGKGPVDLFPAERVREPSAHPGQKRQDGGERHQRLTPSHPHPNPPPSRGRELNQSFPNGEFIATDQVILALGHSARDSFEMLHRRGVHIEPKPFSIGFRIEHPQTLINRCRLGSEAAHPVLGAADYKLVHHCRNGRSVYSFCMCPGGQVVAATSEEGLVVTNGMSHYSRNERNANAGIVVDITPADFGSNHPLAGIALQRELEEQAFELGGKNYNAPVQRVGDFLAGRPSTGPGSVIPSYTPGVTWTDLSDALPDYAIAAIREAIPAFDKTLKGFAMDDAVLTAVETRTSAPIRITRDENFESTNTKGLFPAGEGAGFAGGIISAAVDGMKVAEAVAQKITQCTLG